MSSISVAKHKKKHHPVGWCFFLPRSIGASRLAPQGVAAAELGSHFPPEDRGACSPDAGRGNLRTKCEYPSAQNGQSR